MHDAKVGLPHNMYLSSFENFPFPWLDVLTFKDDSTYVSYICGGNVSPNSLFMKLYFKFAVTTYDHGLKSICSQESILVHFKSDNAKYGMDQI